MSEDFAAGMAVGTIITLVSIVILLALSRVRALQLEVERWRGEVQRMKIEEESRRLKEIAEGKDGAGC